MCSDVLPALIGVGGVLGGTVLGWALNSWSQRGKLSFYGIEWKDYFEVQILSGEFVPSNSRDQTQSYRYTLVTEIYNSSHSTKIMRDIKIEFFCKDSLLIFSIPYDVLTYDTRMNLYRDVAPKNIMPQTVLRLDLRSNFTLDQINNIWEVNRIKLTYKDEKDRKKEVLLRDYNYANHFNNVDTKI